VQAAARLQNFSHAATLLGMTQSAVSQHVTVVEQTIGQPLFRRLEGEQAGQRRQGALDCH
jgi:DNA-binding transcriptional LysR family regulator